jgi:hypothetical protein
MDERDSLIEWLNRAVVRTQDTLEPLSDEQLWFRPDPEGNDIGVTLWHLGRWFDVLATRILARGDSADERWFREGWATRWSYDPRGLGYLETGTMSGYSLEQVKQIPHMTKMDYRSYLDSAAADACKRLGAITPDQLRSDERILDRTRHEWAVLAIEHCFEHLGEIKALIATQRRLTASSR